MYKSKAEWLNIALKDLSWAERERREREYEHQLELTYAKALRDGHGWQEAITEFLADLPDPIAANRAFRRLDFTVADDKYLARFTSFYWESRVSRAVQLTRDFAILLVFGYIMKLIFNTQPEPIWLIGGQCLLMLKPELINALYFNLPAPISRL